MHLCILKEKEKPTLIIQIIGNIYLFILFIHILYMYIRIYYISIVNF